MNPTIQLEGYIIHTDKKIVGIASKNFCFYFLRNEIEKIQILKAKAKVRGNFQLVNVSLKKGCSLQNLHPIDLYKSSLSIGLVPFAIASRENDATELTRNETFSRLEKKFVNNVKRLYQQQKRW